MRASLVPHSSRFPHQPTPPPNNPHNRVQHGQLRNPLRTQLHAIHALDATHFQIPDDGLSTDPPQQHGQNQPLETAILGPGVREGAERGNEFTYLYYAPTREEQRNA